MTILVAIANYGTGNRKFVERLIQEYREMPFDTHVVILSDREKDFGDDAEVRVGLPAKDPWSLPFAHKQLFAERVDDYDLYIYSEDDTLITERNIQAFLDATAVVPHPRIAGFMRYEEAPNGERTCSTVHSWYRWKPETVERIGGYMVAEYTNAHAAAFLLTQKQLRHAIESGGFVVEPHSEHYDLPCTAATDPYTQCGMAKVIPISHLDDFLLHHMPNKYVGKLGIPLSELNAQIALLCRLDGSRGAQLFPPEKLFGHSLYNKSYYEIVDGELVDELPRAGTVLSIGCGSGSLEAELVRRGLLVSAICLDEVIAESARSRGIDVLSHRRCPDGEISIAETAAGRTFDIVLLSNVLQHMKDPQQLLRDVSRVTSPTGTVVGTAPNFGKLPRRTAARELRRLGYADTLLHPTDAKLVRRWLAHSGFAGRVTSHRIKPRFRTLSRLSGGLFDGLLADEVLFVGSHQYKRIQ